MEPMLPDPKSRVPQDLTDHLVEEILVRIGAPADLARATAACKAFRRLINDAAFLRRYRSLHPPLLLGFIGPGSGVDFFPADAPHPNAPAALAFAGTAGFSFGHLPHRRAGWHRCDARGGRVLLKSSELERGLVLPELAVCECDPFTQVYKLLPPIPDNLLASVSVQVQDENIDYFDAFFDPSGGCQEEQFRVMCWTRCPTRGAIFVYSSVSRSWTHGASVSWDALGLDLELLQAEFIGLLLPFQWPSYAYGCLYWKVFLSKRLIKLSINSMKFSTVSLPSDYEKRHIVVVEAGEGRIRMFSLSRGNPPFLRYYTRQNESEYANMHPVETTIPLPEEYDRYQFDGAAEGYIFLIGRRRELSPMSAFFSLEIKTMKVEKVCLSNRVPHHIIPYFGFPPFMSPRRM